MKAIVHIGAPKTGSSTIQEFLFRNTAALAERGFRFHRNVEGRGSQYEYPLAALASIGRLLPGREEQTRYSSTDLAAHQATGAAVVAELAANRARWQEPVALFSSEHIFPWLRSVEEMQALDALFRKDFSEVRYILYIRNQEDLIVSEYSEILKRGSNLRLQGLIDQRMNSLDHEPRTRMWVQAVGRQNFDLRLMDPTYLKDGDLLADYALACGFDLQGLEIPPRINESLTAPAAEALRMLNERIPQLLHDASPNPLRKGLIHHLMDLSPEDAPRLALSADQRAQVLDRVGAANESLRAEFFPDRATLFSPPRERPLPPRETVLEQAMDLMTRLIIRLRLGRMAVLGPQDRVLAAQRAPGGLSNGIAAPPKPGTPPAPPTPARKRDAGRAQKRTPKSRPLAGQSESPME